MKHTPRCSVCKKALPLKDGKVEHWHCAKCRETIALLSRVHDEEILTDDSPRIPPVVIDWRRK